MTVSRTSALAEARKPEQSNGDFWVAMSRQIGQPRRQATPVTLREATSYLFVFICVVPNRVILLLVELVIEFLYIQ